MYTVEDIKNELNKISESVGDTFNIPIKINSRLTSTLGRVVLLGTKRRCTVDRMEFSAKFLETATEETIKSVITHEWVHYYVAKTTGEAHGHDSYFKEMCAKIGCDNDKSFTTVERTVEGQSPYKYSVYCPTCGKVIGYYSRMCSTLRDLPNCTCGRCGKGGLYYTQNW